MQSQIEAASAALGLKVAKGGAAVSVSGWALSSDMVAVIGLGIAIAGFAVNFYFNFKRDRREQKEHEARMRGM